MITDDKEIRQLNQTYRGVDRPTNVLAFPMQEGPFAEVTPTLLGDVVISAETASREATEAEIDLMARISQLLVHGILHLKGYDHETGERQAEEMMEKSRWLLGLIEPNSDLPVF